jgi:hypothetical protein
VHSEVYRVHGFGPVQRDVRNAITEFGFGFGHAFSLISIEFQRASVQRQDAASPY